MKLAEATLYSFSLPMVQPLALAGAKLSSRQGLILRVKDADDHIGWGEVSPLPGYSKETLSEATAQLQQILPCLKEEAEASLSDLCPSVQFGIQSAILGLQAARDGKNLASLLSKEPRDTIEVNGLLTAGLDAKKTTGDLIERGYTCIKIKVGKQTIQEDLARVRDVAKVAGKDIRIRLDANQAWTFDQGVRFLESLEDVEIEYIEEPLADPGRLQELGDQSGIPIALDESLAELSLGQLARSGWAHALIIKPTVLGSVDNCRAICQTAEKIGAKIAFTGCFESSLGISIVAQLAAALGSPDCACGLSTGSHFANDTLAKPVKIEAGQIIIAQLADPCKLVNTSVLQEIARV